MPEPLLQGRSSTNVNTTISIVLTHQHYIFSKEHGDRGEIMEDMYTLDFRCTERFEQITDNTQPFGPARGVNNTRVISHDATRRRVCLHPSTPCHSLITRYAPLRNRRAQWCHGFCFRIDIFVFFVNFSSIIL